MTIPPARVGIITTPPVVAELSICEVVQGHHSLTNNKHIGC